MHLHSLIRYLKHKVKYFLFSNYRTEYKSVHYIKQEKERISKLPRYIASYTYILGNRLEFLDICVLDNYHEIFEKEIYKFRSTNLNPYIIDCGSNIGLSIIYFKMLYPNSKIIGFEADPDIYKVLCNNIKNFGINNVDLYQKAVWKNDTDIEFFLEGGNSSRVATEVDKTNKILVPAISLRPFINQYVDFLKIDIEGAEYEVIKNCQDILWLVKNLFIEYHSFTNRDQNLSNLLSILSDNGFRYYIVHTGVESPYPFVDINLSLGMDLQLNIFAYRQ